MTNTFTHNTSRKPSRRKEQRSRKPSRSQEQILSLQTKNDELNLTLQTVINQRNDFENRLRDIYNSYGWRLLRHVYLWRDQILPPGFSLKQTRLFLSSLSHRLRQRLASTKTSFTPKSKKLVYVDHSFHRDQTKSTMFFIDILKRCFQVETLWHDDWYGHDFPDLSHVDDSYAGIVFFQVMPDQQNYQKLKNKNIIFVPMYDHSVKEDATWWHQYPGLKIINFSYTLHNQVTDWGCRSIYVQRFSEPQKFTPGNPKKVFFYCRGETINFQVVKKLLGHIKNLKIHIHKTMDPGQTFVPPTTTDIKKYHITFSEWFEKKSDKWKTTAPMGLLIAPRPYEGIGQDFIEGMSYGKVVVAPNLPTMNEYIVHNHTGYLYDIHNPQPINISHTRQIQKNVHKYIRLGWKKWQEDQQKIIAFIKS